MSEYDPNYVEEKHFYRIGVKIVIVNGRGEVLLLKRSQLSPRPGGLDLPGGGVDDHESPENAIIRETMEELGISIAQPKIIGSWLMDEHQDPWIMLGFSAHVDDAKVTLSWEHDEYIWMPLNEVSSTELPEGYQQIIRAYKK
jgi:8-oxo-dGTP pyrophosphatase MutT (NUDIX family)